MSRVIRYIAVRGVISLGLLGAHYMPDTLGVHWPAIVNLAWVWLL